MTSVIRWQSEDRWYIGYPWVSRLHDHHDLESCFRHDLTKLKMDAEPLVPQWVPQVLVMSTA